MKKNLLSIMLSITLAFAFSCKDYMSVNPDGYIPADKSFKNADDAISSVYGLYAMMQPLVDQIYLAGEAQGDLVVSARGADNWISEIAQNRVTPENPYTDYTNFYKLIVACNNVTKGLGNILRTDPVNYPLAKYTFNLAEITCIRAWTYLQLVKIWGDVPYISTDITSVDQITAVAPEKRDVILGRILKDVKDNYTVMQASWIRGTYDSRAVFSSSGSKFLLSEIYLESGDLPNAWQTIIPTLPFGERDAQTRGEISFSATPPYWPQRVFQFSGNEWAFFIDFDGSKGQKNSLQYWTNNKNGGIYALKPSRNAVNNWSIPYSVLVNYQTTVERGLYFDPPIITIGAFAGYYTSMIEDSEGNFIPGFKGDSLRGAGYSYNIDGGDTLIFKYLFKERFVSRSILLGDANSNDDADFCVYRAGPFAILTYEMINNMGMPWEALQYMNGGFAGQQFYGTRMRALLMPFRMDPNEADPVRQVNRYILEEAALEGAFEGTRWFNLVRFSRRPGYESWLGEYVSQKYPPNQREAIKARLSNPAYWYFPYYYKNTVTNKLLHQKPGY